METPQLALYLRLLHSDWLGPALFSRLLCRTDSLQNLLRTDPESLADLGLTSLQIAQLHKTASTSNSKEVDAELEWSRQSTNAIVCFEDECYPALLKQIDVPPPVLFVRGRANILNNIQIAIVGSRNATSYGLRNAYWMAHELGAAGLNITSGMARGIDSRAHRGALASGQATIAIIGTGADITYPPSNTKLADEIAVNGALVSEFPLGMPPLPMNFPRRNRIMSGLSIGTLVVEASLKSGSLITARLALEQNREVFAIPGLISNPQAAGCHQLITDGARLVEQPTDILRELGISTNIDSVENGALQTDTSQASFTNEKSDLCVDRITRLIGYQGCELQYLLDTSGLEYQALLSTLLELEITGKIRTAGGRYYRC